MAFYGITDFVPNPITNILTPEFADLPNETKLKILKEAIGPDIAEGLMRLELVSKDWQRVTQHLWPIVVKENYNPSQIDNALATLQAIGRDVTWKNIYLQLTRGKKQAVTLRSGRNMNISNPFILREERDIQVSAIVQTGAVRYRVTGRNLSGEIEIPFFVWDKGSGWSNVLDPGEYHPYQWRAAPGIYFLHLYCVNPIYRHLHYDTNCLARAIIEVCSGSWCPIQ